MSHPLLLSDVVNFYLYLNCFFSGLLRLILMKLGISDVRTRGYGVK